MSSVNTIASAIDGLLPDALIAYNDVSGTGTTTVQTAGITSVNQNVSPSQYNFFFLIALAVVAVLFILK